MRRTPALRMLSIRGSIFARTGRALTLYPVGTAQVAGPGASVTATRFRARSPATVFLEPEQYLTYPDALLGDFKCPGLSLLPEVLTHS